MEKDNGNVLKEKINNLKENIDEFKKYHKDDIDTIHKSLRESTNENRVTKKNLYDKIEGEITMIEKTIKNVNLKMDEVTKELTKLGFKILVGFLGFLGTAVITLIVFIYLNNVR